MKILLTPTYSVYNNGDAAIVSAQIAELRRVFPGADITILTIDVAAPGETFDACPVYSALMFCAVNPAHANRLRKLVAATAMLVYATIWAVVFRLTRRYLPLPPSWRPALERLAQADMQIGVGGGYLRAKRDLTSTILLVLLFHQIWLAKIMCKPVYQYAQSFGPYPTRLQQRVAKLGLRCVDLLLVREVKSRQLLGELGLASKRVRLVPDSAFLFRPPINAKLRRQVFSALPPGGPIVGVTVRQWLSTKAQAAYEQAVAGFVDSLQARGFRVIFVPQVTSTRQNDDDRSVGRRIGKLLKQNTNVLILRRRFSYRDIKSIFAGLDYLVGTRFHSVIFALTAGVPALAIEYEHKTSGIMQDLDLGQWVVPIEEVTEKKLQTMFDALVHHRAGYQVQLRHALPSYTRKARTAAELIRQAYEYRRGEQAPQA